MIKEVGGIYIRLKHKASCHCGQVELELNLPDGIVNPGGVIVRFAVERVQWLRLSHCQG
jgi:hypothetical protein